MPSFFLYFLTWGEKLNHLELYHLRRFCRKWELDTHLIDNTLTYHENKTILMSQVHTFNLESHAPEFRAQLEEYEHFVRENFLMFYLAYQRSGETVSAEVGEQDKSPPQFSLSEFVTMRNHHRVILSKRRKA